MPCLHAPTGTDYIPVVIPAVDDGSVGAQIFSGVDSRVLDVYGVKSGADFVHTPEDNIWQRGAMDILISDSAQSETSSKVEDLLRAYVIDDWQSEPHHQHQNPTERQIQRAKNLSNRILDRTGAPAFLWLLCLTYVCLLLNHIALDSLNGHTLLEVLTGITPDLSPVPKFRSMSLSTLHLMRGISPMSSLNDLLTGLVLLPMLVMPLLGMFLILRHKRSSVAPKFALL